MVAPRLFITITGMSGAGKGAVIKLLCSYDPTLKFLITATTRPPRAHEVHGQHYYFMTKAEFAQRQQAGDFLETNTLFYGNAGPQDLAQKGNFYGTLRQVVLDNFAAGYDVVGDLEINGVRQVRQKMPDQLISLALLPPSREEFERRLTYRAQHSGENPEDVKLRMASALADLEHLHDPQYIFTNKDMAGACQQDFDAVFFNDDLAETANTIARFIQQRRQRS